MQKFEIPLYIWLNSMFLFAAIGYIWGKLAGEAEEHARHVRAHNAHLPA